MADNEVLDSWEELEDNDVLDRKLQEIKIKPQEESHNSSFIPVVCEDSGRTQYQPQFKILKRQTENGAEETSSDETRKPSKTIAQREAEYAEARLRILGVGYDAPQKETPEKDRPIRLLEAVAELKVSNSVRVSRWPKGPDTTKGFNLQR